MRAMPLLLAAGLTVPAIQPAIAGDRDGHGKHWPSPYRASRNSSANPPHSRPGDRSARPNHELHLRIDDRAMRFKSRSRRISVWNSTAPRWARKVMNRRYARSACAWRNTA
jgi:hypothetical protein